MDKIRSKRCLGHLGLQDVTVSPVLAMAEGDTILTGADLAHEGDAISVKFGIKLSSVATPPIEGTIVLGARPELAVDAPVITDVEVDTSDPYNDLIRVRFAPDHPVGAKVRCGGWRLVSLDRPSVSDNGVAPDEIAGDGWYTGRTTAPKALRSAPPSTSSEPHRAGRPSGPLAPTSCTNATGTRCDGANRTGELPERVIADQDG